MFLIYVRNYTSNYAKNNSLNTSMLKTRVGCQYESPSHTH